MDLGGVARALLAFVERAVSMMKEAWVDMMATGGLEGTRDLVGGRGRGVEGEAKAGRA